ncbi:nucleoside triphosphate pyrophosphohydrolase [bacterium]|nr:nucleoside triphosphate pyrophosphohydrolase [bacterium]
MATLHPSSSEFQQLSPFFQLVEIMAALRAPDGCPWDLRQDHRTLTPFLIEETYECVEAIELADDDKMCEELGDLMLQIVFHSQLGREQGRFDVDQVCRGIVAKMIRRHPHVFEREQNLGSAQEVLQQWDQIKKEEKGESHKSALDGVSPGLPALPQAALLLERAARGGFAYADAAGAWEKLDEELQEFRQQPSESELGDVLFALVSLAQLLGMDAESALRQTNRKFRQRFAGLEKRFPEGMQQQSPQQLVSAWRELARSE